MVASISVGIYQGVPVLDLDYAEDSNAETDMNVVMNENGQFIEIQGTAEGETFSMDEMIAMTELAKEGITSGCGSGNFCPNDIVTRAQMSVFLLRAKHGNSYFPPAATGVFKDVPLSYWAVNWVEQLAVEGITSGCGSGNFCPNDTATRAQMAVFLTKTFNLTMP